MKTAKHEGKILFSSIEKLNDRSVQFDVAVNDKIESYGVIRSTLSADDFTVLKFDGSAVKSEYKTSYWRSTCTCPGFKHGYICRHMRMCKALQQEKIL